MNIVFLVTEPFSHQSESIDQYFQIIFKTSVWKTSQEAGSHVGTGRGRHFVS